MSVTGYTGAMAETYSAYLGLRAGLLEPRVTSPGAFKTPFISVLFGLLGKDCSKAQRSSPSVSMLKV